MRIGNNTMILTAQDIQDALKDIKHKAKQYDHEAAHGEEDKLAWSFIEHVAKTATGELQEMATQVLKSQKIQFRRLTA